MKFLDEYRDAALALKLSAEIRRSASRPWNIMEICGGQTHSIMKFGIEKLLPESITLLHGPGCPVCVTPASLIDSAHALAMLPGVSLASFGDMLRVPGSRTDLLRLKAAGADVRVVSSPLDAVKFAIDSPARQVVFFAVGFETTAPASALAVLEAAQKGLGNFSLLSAHVTVAPAIEMLLASPQCAIDGFLAAGHVCAVMGCAQYSEIATKHSTPMVVTGFEPIDILHGILLLVQQLEGGTAQVQNQYSRAVRPEGSPVAQRLMDKVFQPVDRAWRGLSLIPGSGLALRDEFAGFDAEKKFGLPPPEPERPSECIAGSVMQGLRKPRDCPGFGLSCTPDHPVGAAMVSSEGACAAYYRYARAEQQAQA